LFELESEFDDDELAPLSPSLLESSRPSLLDSLLDPRNSSAMAETAAFHDRPPLAIAGYAGWGEGGERCERDEQSDGRSHLS